MSTIRDYLIEDNKKADGICVDKIARINQLGELEYTSAERRTSRRRVEYVLFITPIGKVHYFPNGKYGASLVQFANHKKTPPTGQMTVDDVLAKVKITRGREVEEHG